MIVVDAIEQPSASILSWERCLTINALDLARYAAKARVNRGDDWDSFVAEARANPLEIAYEVEELGRDNGSRSLLSADDLALAFDDLVELVRRWLESL